MSRAYENARNGARAERCTSLRLQRQPKRRHKKARLRQPRLPPRPARTRRMLPLGLRTGASRSFRPDSQRKIARVKARRRRRRSLSRRKKPLRRKRRCATALLSCVDSCTVSVFEVLHHTLDQEMHASMPLPKDMAIFMEGAWYMSVVDVENTLRHVCKKVWQRVRASCSRIVRYIHGTSQHRS